MSNSTNPANSTGFAVPSFMESLKTFIDSVFGIVAPPLASPISDSQTADYVGGFNVNSMQNTVETDGGQPSGPNTGSFASSPTRYMNANRMFGIPTIDDQSVSVDYPAEFAPSQNLYDFFKSSSRITYQLPSVNDVNRYNSQNNSDND